MARRLFSAWALWLLLVSCSDPPPTSDDVQRQQQERLLLDGTSQVGMPAIKNFRERKLLKDILELRDQANLTTYTYVQSQMTGKLLFLCDSIGYGIPYATQFTSPAKLAHGTTGAGHHVLFVVPQADPNGLFSPASADGTWVMCKDPNGADVKPLFVEPRVVVSPFRLTGSAIEGLAAETPKPVPSLAVKK